MTKRELVATGETPAPPCSWIVMVYNHANGWPAAPNGCVFKTKNDAEIYAEKCAKVSPGIAYVVFKAASWWQTEPGQMSRGEW